MWVGTYKKKWSLKKQVLASWWKLVIIIIIPGPKQILVADYCRRQLKEISLKSNWTDCTHGLLADL